MTGNEEYKKKFRSMALKRIKEIGNDELESFYYYLNSNKSPSTSYNYLNYVINFINTLGITDFSTITFNTYNKYLTLIDEKTSQYRIAVYHALEKFSTYLAANNITEDYMENIERPTNIESKETKEKREEGVFSENDLKESFHNILNSNSAPIWKQRDFSLCLLLLSSGMRSSALEKLDVDDVNFDKNEVIITEKRSSVRNIILPDETMNELKKWIEYRDTIKPETSALFISNQKKRMNQKTIYRCVKKYTGKHPHTFRATYGTTLYDTTGDLFFTQQCMGHTNPKTTELYIRGKNSKIAEKAVSIMGDCIKKL